MKIKGIVFDFDGLIPDTNNFEGADIVLDSLSDISLIELLQRLKIM